MSIKPALRRSMPMRRQLYRVMQRVLFVLANGLKKFLTKVSESFILYWPDLIFKFLEDFLTILMLSILK